MSLFVLYLPLKPIIGNICCKNATNKDKVRSKINYWFIKVKTPMKDLNDLYIFALIVEHGGLSKVEQKQVYLNQN